MPHCSRGVEWRFFGDEQVFSFFLFLLFMRYIYYMYIIYVDGVRTAQSANTLMQNFLSRTGFESESREIQT